MKKTINYSAIIFSLRALHISYTRIGEMLCISKQRVHEIHKKTLEKLKKTNSSLT